MPVMSTMRKSEVTQSTSQMMRRKEHTKWRKNRRTRSKETPKILKKEKLLSAMKSQRGKRIKENSLQQGIASLIRSSISTCLNMEHKLIWTHKALDFSNSLIHNSLLLNMHNILLNLTIWTLTSSILLLQDSNHKWTSMLHPLCLPRPKLQLAKWC